MWWLTEAPIGTRTTGAFFASLFTEETYFVLLSAAQANVSLKAATTATKHAGFAEQIKRYSDRGVRSAFRNFSKNIAKHKDKLAEAIKSGDKGLVKYYIKEIQSYGEQLKIVVREIAKRGLR